MALLSIQNLVYSLGERKLLNGLNFTLNAGERVGLVGRNGCGKSTLLKMVAGVGTGRPEEGQLHIPRGTRVGYLHQDHALDPEKTLIEEAMGAFAHEEDLHNRLADLAEALATTHTEGAKQAELLAEYERIEHMLAAGGGYAYEHKAHEMLAGLGVPLDIHSVKCKDLSGGQRARVALARVLLDEPDILLLDEPTNHLDIAGREWLEEFLRAWKGAVVLVSHDRWLLDRCVNKIVELERGRMVEYPGNYSKFRELRALRMLEQQRLYQRQQEHIASEKAFIDRYRAGQRAAQAQGREKRLERFLDEEAIELPPEMDAMRLHLTPRSRSGDIVAVAEQAGMAYDGKVLFSGLDLTIQRGARIGIIGPNGAGKSTLLRCLLGAQAPTGGTCRTGGQVDFGWFRQTHEHLPKEQTVVEYLRLHTEDQMEQSARDLAGAFLFSGGDQDKAIGMLSGGERSRVMLAGLMSEGHNLLVLDEPTNHLDIPAAERLEEALSGYVKSKPGYTPNGRQGGEGTLLLITHDRWLLDRLVDQLLVFDGQGGVRLFLGTYSDYVAAVKAGKFSAAAPAAKPAAPKPATKPAQPPAPAPKPAPSKPAAAPSAPPSAPLMQKPGRKNKALASLTTERLEAKIMEVEERKKALEAQLADPDTYRDRAKFDQLMAQHEQAGTELASLEEEWGSR